MKLFKRLIVIIIALIITNLSVVYGWDTPTQNAPVNNSQVWNFVNFDWAPVYYSDGYQIQVDTSANFNSAVLVDTIIPYVDTTGFGDTQFTFDDMYFGETYFWRVRAFVTNDTSLWSPSWSINTRDDVELDLPALSSDNYVSVLLDWNSHIGVDFYDYEIDTSANFNSPVLYSGIDIYFSEQNSFFDSEQNVGNLLYGETYHWRVRARNSIDTSAWSASSFNTMEFVEAVSPTNGIYTPTGVLIDWDEFKGAYYYDYQIDVNSNFNSPNLISGSDMAMNNGSSNTDTEEFIDNLYFGTSYFWRVRSRHGVDTSEWVVNTFMTTDNIELVSPSPGSFSECEILLDWNSHPGVTAYEYQVDITSSFNSINLISGQNVYINTNSSNSDTEILASPLLFGTQYFWRVRAINSSDTSSWSDVWNFNTIEDIILSYPGNSASTFTTLTFDWEDFDGATTYTMVLDTSLQFNSPLAVTTNNIGVSEKIVENLFFGYNYYWKVRAENSIDVSEWSEVRTFFTYNEVGLFTPSNGELNVDTLGVLLDWWYHNGATEYQLEIDSSNVFNTNFLIQESFSFIAPVANGPDTEYLTGNLEDDKIFFWRVRIINEVDTSNWETRWFNTGSFALNLPQLPTLLSPLHGELEVTIDPVLDWSDVNGATGYYYEYSEDPDFNTFVTAYVTQSDVSIGTLDYVTTYFWRVRSYDGNLISDWTLPYTFTTAQEELSPPGLIAPSNTASALPVDNVFFDWTDVIHAQNYELVYSSFDNFLFDVVTELATQSQFSAGGLTPGTTYYWKVKSLNDTLINSTYSDVWSFTTQLQLEMPVLLSPLDNSFNNPYNNLTLSWEAVPNAEGYIVQYARDNGFTLDMVEEIAVDSYHLIQSLEEDTEYYWRVKSTSGTLYNSEFTYAWSFKTDEDTTNSIFDIETELFSIYPNPTNGLVAIDISQLSLAGNTLIKIFDYTGREVMSMNSIDNIIKLDIAGFKTGVYFISILNDKKYYYNRIIKN